MEVAVISEPAVCLLKLNLFCISMPCVFANASALDCGTAFFGCIFKSTGIGDWSSDAAWPVLLLIFFSNSLSWTSCLSNTLLDSWAAAYFLRLNEFMNELSVSECDLRDVESSRFAVSKLESFWLLPVSCFRLFLNEKLSWSLSLVLPPRLLSVFSFFDLFRLRNSMLNMLNPRPSLRRLESKPLWIQFEFKLLINIYNTLFQGKFQYIFKL